MFLDDNNTSISRTKIARREFNISTIAGNYMLLLALRNVDHPLTASNVMELVKREMHTKISCVYTSCIQWSREQCVTLTIDEGKLLNDQLLLDIDREKERIHIVSKKRYSEMQLRREKKRKDKSKIKKHNKKRARDPKKNIMCPKVSLKSTRDIDDKKKKRKKRKNNRRKLTKTNMAEGEKLQHEAKKKATKTPVSTYAAHVVSREVGILVKKIVIEGNREPDVLALVDQWKDCWASGSGNPPTLTAVGLVLGKRCVSRNLVNPNVTTLIEKYKQNIKAIDDCLIHQTLSQNSFKVSSGSLNDEEIKVSSGSLNNEGIKVSSGSLEVEEIKVSSGSLEVEEIKMSSGSLEDEEIKVLSGSLEVEEIKVLSGSLNDEV